MCKTDCAVCARVEAYYARPTMSSVPTVRERVEHIRHLVRDHPTKAPAAEPGRQGPPPPPKELTQ